MQHILKTYREELERTHRLVQSYKPSHFKSIVFSFLPRSFKKVFGEYAEIKERTLLEYQELYNDIQSKKLNLYSVNTIKKELISITHLIEKSSKLLSRLVAHSDIQEDILKHEKIFFLKLLESFQNDILLWVGDHETKSLGKNENNDQKNILENITISETLKILQEKKKKLEEYIKNNS